MEDNQKSTLGFAGICRNGQISSLDGWTKRIGYKDPLWPTPMARLGTARGAQAKRYKAAGRSADLDDAVAFFGTTDAPAGVTAPRGGWPTPTARDGKSGPGQSATAQGGMNLRTAVLQFPTPTARDWKSGNASQATMVRNSRPLSEVVTGGKGGTLNPIWVEWLMGFDGTWTT